MGEVKGSTDLVVRYHAMLSAIGECYKQRKAPEYLQFGAGLAPGYRALFADYLEYHKAEMPDVEIKGAGFMQLSTLLSDAGEFEQAIELCRQAQQLGLSDGTVTGFEGRLARIEKARDKVAG
jgi:hypothetical protein